MALCSNPTLRRATRLSVLACAALASVHAGCLDAGAPPVGRQLLASRDQDQVQLVPGPPGVPARILLSHIQDESTDFEVMITQRLSALSDPGPGSHPTPARVLVERAGCNLVGFNQCPLPAVDANGRIYVGDVANRHVLRIDPETGEQSIVGHNGTTPVKISSTGTRILVLDYDDVVHSRWYVLGLDGSGAILTDASYPSFVGDAFFYVADDGRLMVIPSGSAESVPLSADVQSYEALDTQRGSLMLLHRSPSGAPQFISTALFDPVTLVESALPATTAGSIAFYPSPDGRYLASTGPGITSGLSASRFTILDLDTDLEDTVNLPSPWSSYGVWRPGHPELWLGVSDQVWRWPVGGSAVPAPGGSLPYVPAALGVTTSPHDPVPASGLAFTPDGRYRLVEEKTDDPPVDQSGAGTTTRFLVQSADDDRAAPLRLNQDHAGIRGVFAVGDGRLLSESSYADRDRNDVYLVDPGAGTLRLVTSTGNVVALGRNRYLGLQRWVPESSSGDLTLIDYATGTETVIASNVYSVVVDESKTPGDALAPGTRVVYLVRNRIASPSDGCWTVALP